ncbi:MULTISPECIES: MarR family winged helix-turn-helix transcriptional regulator [Lactobacillus]|uniref:MarR family winged helix-turn-helix transcriptional regulator n=1 Tax=Lactobacillus TaxID=1578 RepID=UPI0018DD24A9|nr:MULTISPECIES: MarR family transcriptional regulator [Lactobacillus]MBI0022541.1 MarR family transcriptional regulator [Lactobacillus sp. W8172]
MNVYLNRIGPKIKAANTLIEKQLNNQFGEMFKEYSLTGAQISLMVFLYEAKDRTVTQKEIADMFVLSHPTIRGIVRRLEENGLIYTTHLETDQRQIVLQLSDKGFALVDKNITKIHAILDNTNAQITQGSSVVEVEQFEAFLDQIIEGFK